MSYNLMMLVHTNFGLKNGKLWAMVLPDSKEERRKRKAGISGRKHELNER